MNRRWVALDEGPDMAQDGLWMASSMVSVNVEASYASATSCL